MLPVGFDAVIDALLQGDVPRAIAAHRLAAAAGSPASAGIASETLVGSRKANGRPTSNEDAVVWTARGTRALLVVCDGITGTGEGSGYRAAHAAVEAAASAWQATGDLDALRAAADQAATSAGGGATLVAVDFDAGLGSASILSLGDSSAWLVRANGEVTTAFRLSPIQTVHAALLVNDPHALGFESVLTHFLGGAAGQPYTGEIGTRPGDLLVVCSDGTDVDDSVESFASALSRIATEVRGAGRPVGPATAVELVIRAERVSGFDNATAAVVSFTG